MNARLLTYVPCLLIGVAATCPACTIVSAPNSSDGGASGSSGSSSSSSGSSGSSGSSSGASGDGNGDGGSSGDAGGVYADSGPPCQFGEPNDTRDQAFAVQLGTPYIACIGSTADKDFYAFTAPADPEGGYVVAELTNVGPGWIQGTFFTTSDNAIVHGGSAANSGASLKLYIAVTSGTKYDFMVDHYVSGETFNYDMKLTYTKFPDPSVASHTRATAPALTLGTASPGLFSAGYTGGTIPLSDYDRYYKVALTPGTATVKVDNVASDFWAQVRVIDDSNQTLVTTTSSGMGANLSTSAMITTAGTYYIVPGGYIGGPKASGTGDAPDSFSHKFALTVTE